MLFAGLVARLISDSVPRRASKRRLIVPLGSVCISVVSNFVCQCFGGGFDASEPGIITNCRHVTDPSRLQVSGSAFVCPLAVNIILLYEILKPNIFLLAFKLLRKEFPGQMP